METIGLDTNLVVRFITQDDTTQTKNVRKLLESYRGNLRSLYIADVSLCEIIWVLKTAYKYDKKSIVETLQALMGIEEFRFSSKELIKQALALYENGKASFADYFIILKNKEAGCEYTYSFDKTLLKESIAVPVPN